MTQEKTNLLNPEHNVWRQAKAGSLGLLVNGEEYFIAARDAMMSARRRIMLLAWEFHSQTELVRESVTDGFPRDLGPFLDALLEKNESLEIYILVWDYSLIFLQEREWKIFSQWWQKPHPRLHLVSDDTVPKGASHHQKILSVDEHLAFCGGLDLSISRWDTTAHRFREERRVNPDGRPYDPYHDVHTVLDGEAARELSELARQRWAHATGEELEPLSREESERHWPKSVEKTFTDVEVGISRTFASPEEEIPQVEQLHLDLFEAAQSMIFIENQYFSSQKLCEALEKRLGERHGPSVVMILPRDASGWLVKSTMGLLRDRLLERLEQADNHGRFRVYTPLVSEGDETKAVYVHAKVLIVDDRILKIGSSNLSNRSMRVDSEVDLTLDLPKPDPRITRFRQRLLAIHHNLSPGEWANREKEKGGLLAALDEGRKNEGHHLQPLEYGCDSDVKRWLADTQLLDPDDPIDPGYWVKKNVRTEERPYVWRRLLSVVGSITAAILVGFAIVWVWREFLGERAALDFLNTIKGNPWSPAIVIMIFIIGGCLGVPLNFMLVTTTIIMGSAIALSCGMTGAFASSLMGYYLGHLLGRPLVRKFGSGTVETLNRKLGERSYRSVAIARLLPVAPFFLINMVSGASHLRFKEYVLGTILGMAPGMGAVVLLADRAEAVAERPDWLNILTFLVLVAVMLGVVFYIRRILRPAHLRGQPSK